MQKLELRLSGIVSRAMSETLKGLVGVAQKLWATEALALESGAIASRVGSLFPTNVCWRGKELCYDPLTELSFRAVCN